MADLRLDWIRARCRAPRADRWQTGRVPRCATTSSTCTALTEVRDDQRTSNRQQVGAFISAPAERCACAVLSRSKPAVPSIATLGAPRAASCARSAALSRSADRGACDRPPARRRVRRAPWTPPPGCADAGATNRAPASQRDRGRAPAGTRAVATRHGPAADRAAHEVGVAFERRRWEVSRGDQRPEPGCLFLDHRFHAIGEHLRSRSVHVPVSSPAASPRGECGTWV